MVEEKEKDEKSKEENLRFIRLTADTTFKYLYKDEDTRGWINNIIKQKFNIDLEGYKLIDNELNTGNKIKDYRLDLCLEKDGLVVIIEMNQDYYDFLESKNYQYLYRVAGKRYDQGETYSNKLTKLVLFNYFKNHENENVKTANYQLMDPENSLVIKDIESYEIYLPNFKNICYDNDVDISLSLFNAKSYEDMRKLTNNPTDLKIIRKLEELAMDEAFLFDYDHEKVRKKTENSIREESLRKGIEQGIEQEKQEIAKNMLSKNMELNLISELTGLTIEEINNLKD